MPDYSKGKIYKIVCNKTGLVYVGSTCCTLKKRLKQHEHGFNNYINNKSNILISSFFILLQKDYQMILLEEFPSINKKQLVEREYYYIDILDSVNFQRYQCNSDYYCKSDKIIQYRERHDKRVAQYDYMVQKIGPSIKQLIFRTEYILEK